MAWTLGIRLCKRRRDRHLTSRPIRSWTALSGGEWIALGLARSCPRVVVVAVVAASLESPPLKAPVAARMPTTTRTARQSERHHQPRSPTLHRGGSRRRCGRSAARACLRPSSAAQPIGNRQARGGASVGSRPRPPLFPRKAGSSACGATRRSFWESSVASARSAGSSLRWRTASARPIGSACPSR